MKTRLTPKYSVGSILRFRGDNSGNPIKLVVLANGVLKTYDNATIIYHVSIEKDGEIKKSILNETEVEIYPIQ